MTYPLSYLLKSFFMSSAEMFRELRNITKETIRRKTLTPLSVEKSSPFGEVLGVAFIACIAVWLVLWGMLSFFPVAAPCWAAFEIGLMAACLFLVFPFVSLIRIQNKGIKVTLSSWREYPSARQFIACMAIILIVGTALNKGSRYFFYESLPEKVSLKKVSETDKTTKGTLKQKASPQKQAPQPQKPQSLSDLFPVHWLQVYFFLWPVSSLGLWFLMFVLSERSKKRESLTQIVLNPASFSLWVGRSTGALVNLWHDANMDPHQEISLTLEDASQNIVVLGAIGSGKTTRAMHPLLVQLLDQDCGGLIFDIKGDFKQAVSKFSGMTKRDIISIGVNQKTMNLLEGLSPEIATSFLKSALLLAGSSKADSFWVDTAVELCRSALGVLSFVPKEYTLSGLYLYLFDTSFQEKIDKRVKGQKLQDGNKRLLKTYQQYLKSIFASFEEKIRSGVLANVSQILSPFQHPELVDTFCTSHEDPCLMEAVLEGAVYCVDMPLAKWGLGGKVIYTLIKLRFFNVMQQRVIHQDWNQTRPVFFLCDEYQEIVSCNKDGLSDLNFWDKSRSSRTIGIISAQSVSSFYASIGDRDLVHALLQNFRQKLVFRIEDDWTISYCNRLLGQVETQKIVYSTGSSTVPGKVMKTDSSTRSINYQQKELIDGKLFRTMEPNQALALLSLKGRAADDILIVKPVFADE